MEITNLELARKYWAEMPTSERIRFLHRLGAAIKRKQYVSWDGKPVKELAEIQTFNELPADLKTHLLGATTKTGFSIDEEKKLLSINEKMRKRLGR